MSVKLIKTFLLVNFKEKKVVKFLSDCMVSYFVLKNGEELVQADWGDIQKLFVTDRERYYFDFEERKIKAR